MTVRASSGRRIRAAALTVLVALALPGAGGVAHAAPAASGGYRYWSFWEAADGGKDWSYATQGPSVLRPADGAVLGFRFAVSEGSRDAAIPRGGAPDFGAACARTDAQPGSKRVALSIDFGTAADAPGGAEPPERRTECARVDEDATAADALAAVAKPLRYNSDALLCAIDGYPAKGCGEQLSGDGSGTGHADDGDGAGDGAGDRGGTGAGNGDGGLPGGVGAGAGVAAVAVLAAAAVWQARRRRG